MEGVAWGGSEELWAEMAHLALRKGIQVSAFVPRDPGEHPKWEALRNSGAALFHESSQDGIYRKRLLGRADLVSARLGRFLRARPLRAFFSTAPDVVLISDGGSVPPEQVIDLVCKCHSPRPYVILSQSNRDESIPQEHRKNAAQYYRHAYSALFVAQSNVNATERQLAEKLANARVVRNPVNLKSLDPVQWPTNLDGIRFACVARLHRVNKGHDILFEALSGRRWRERDWSLSLYGSGDEEPYLRDLCACYGLDGRISFCGQVEDIRAIWQTHHALVLATRSEGTPLVVVEAMLCARPVISTAVAGIPEWVRDGRSGFLAQAATADLFASALERAWDRRSEWREMGIDARTDALSLYDPAPGETLLSIVTDAAQHGAGVSHGG